MKLCTECYDIKSSDHTCPTNENKFIKHHVLKSIQFPKLEKVSEDAYAHRLAILKKLVKEYDTLGFDTSKKSVKKVSKKADKKVDKKADKKVDKKSDKKPDKKKTKRNNPYMNYSSKMRRELKEEYPDIPITEMSKIIGKMWRELDENQKEQYR